VTGVQTCALPISRAHERRELVGERVPGLDLERLVERMPLEVEPRNALADELTAFVRAVRGESAPEPSADAGRAALALALAVRARIGETRRQVAGARV